MTSEVLKKQYSMRSIAERYGFKPNRAGFIPCPFHHEKTASMKIYQDSYHCFGCGESGDIFTFIQRMDGVSFKEAFLSIGGAYEKPTFESNLAVYRHRRKRETKKRKAERLIAKRNLNNTLIDIYREYMKRSEAFSEVWTDCCNALQYQLYMQEVLNREEVKECSH